MFVEDIWRQFRADQQQRPFFGEQEPTFDDIFDHFEFITITEMIAEELTVDGFPDIEKMPELRTLYAAEETVKMMRDMTHDRYSELMPYYIDRWTLAGEVIDWIREKSFGKVKIYKNNIYFESKDCFEWCKVIFKKHYIYMPEKYMIFIKYDPETEQNEMEVWLLENIGEQKLTWDYGKHKPSGDKTFSFYDESDAIHFKMVWEE